MPSAPNRGGRVGSSDDDWLMLLRGVELQIAGSRIEFSAPHARMVLKCAPAAAAKLKDARGPVQGLPRQLCEILSEHRFAVRASSASAALALANHAHESVPYNRGLPYDDDQLLTWQQEAVARRFAVADGELAGANVVHRKRSFTTAPEHEREAVDLGELSRLLTDFYTAPTPPYASAGALYPISVVGELNGSQTVRRARPGDASTWLVDRLPEPTTKVTDDPALNSTTGRLWLVADLQRICHKYGPRGYRYALIEAGAAAQFIGQLAERAGLLVRPFGGFDDDAVARSLGLTDGQVVVHCVAVRRAPEPETADGTCVTMSATASAGVTLQLATSWLTGQQPEVGVPLVGQAVHIDADLAVAKSRSELAERLALSRAPSRGLTSNGMAAHPHPSSAKRNAAFELYERHCLLTQWYQQAVPRRLSPPRHQVHRGLLRLAAGQGLTVRYGHIADPHFAIPAAVAIVRSTTSGAILLGSAAASDWESAKSGAAFEVAKAVLHRRERTLRFDEPFFEAHRISVSATTDPWQHESYWANDEVLPAETQIYECTGTCDDSAADPEPAALSEFFAGFSFEDWTSSMSTTSFGGLAVVRATHPAMVPVAFGACTPSYAEHVRRLIGYDPSARWPHPLG